MLRFINELAGHGITALAVTNKAIKVVKSRVKCSTFTFDSFYLKMSTPNANRVYDVLVLEESSLTDEMRAYQVFSTGVRFRALIIIGDHEQVPSHGMFRGAFLEEAKKMFPTFTLQTVHRQQTIDGRSDILDNAKQILARNLNHSYFDNKHFKIRQANSGLDELLSAHAHNNYRDLAVVCGMNMDAAAVNANATLKYLEHVCNLELHQEQAATMAADVVDTEGEGESEVADESVPMEVGSDSEPDEQEQESEMMDGTERTSAVEEVAANTNLPAASTAGLVGEGEAAEDSFLSDACNDSFEEVIVVKPEPLSPLPPSSTDGRTLDSAIAVDTEHGVNARDPQLPPIGDEESDHESHSDVDMTIDESHQPNDNDGANNDDDEQSEGDGEEKQDFDEPGQGEPPQQEEQEAMEDDVQEEEDEQDQSSRPRLDVPFSVWRAIPKERLVHLFLVGNPVIAEGKITRAREDEDDEDMNENYYASTEQKWTRPANTV